MKMKDLQLIDRPQEKLVKYGEKKLTNTELLALILRFGTKDEGVIDLSKKILKLSKNKEATLSNLRKIEGIGISKACQIIACFELSRRLMDDDQAISIFSPHEIFHELKDIRSSKKEHFIAFYLDVRNRVIKRETISLGTLNASLVHPREVFEPAVRLTAASIILTHNHPSGLSTPSDEDLKLTMRLVKVGEILGIKITDHIIVCEKEYTSMKEKGYF
jgi:DNA repair protein RadC